MAVIDPEGLFNGDRLAHCSDEARLYWPYFFLAANSFGRLEISYEKLMGRAFRTFKKRIAKEEFVALIEEYRGNYLLFIYQAGDQLWGQWLTEAKYLPRYHAARDKLSPAPPEAALEAFCVEYQRQKAAEGADILAAFGNVPKSSEMCGKPREVAAASGTFPLGVGVGVGTGVGTGTGAGGGVGDGDGKGLTPFNPLASEAAVYVLDALSLSGDRLRLTVVEALGHAMKKQGLNALAAAEFIVARWQEYERLSLPVKLGKKSFLETGLYNERENWERQDGKSERLGGRSEAFDRALQRADKAVVG